ncbi:hypothetical protein N7524_006434 [Penicillium chrysogenum]|nr:hypothetical protein N7524_006434 [Penicillium chrysogenum]
MGDVCANAEGGAGPADGRGVSHEIGLIGMPLGEISGPSALVMASECGDKSRLKLRVEKEKPTPVLFGTTGRLKTRCGSIALGEFHMMDDFGGGYSEQAWSGQVCSPGARRWSYRSAKDSFPSKSRKENTSHGTRVLGGPSGRPRM